MPFKLNGLIRIPQECGDAGCDGIDRDGSLVDRLVRDMDIRRGGASGMRPREAAAHILGPNIVHRRILIVAAPGSGIHRHLGWLDAHTSGVHLFDSPAQASAASAAATDPTVLLIDIDIFMNLHVALDVLGALRRQAPAQVTLIASTAFGMHDMSCARAAIADASIRLPVSRPELALALGAAVSNNGFVRARGRLH